MQLCIRGIVAYADSRWECSVGVKADVSEPVMFHLHLCNLLTSLPLLCYEAHLGNTLS